MTKNKSILSNDETDILSQIAQVVTNGEYFCSRCNDNGYLLVDNDTGKNQCVLCDCEKDKMWANTLREAGIPPLFHNKTIDGSWWTKQDAGGKELGQLSKKKKRIGEFAKRYIRAVPLFLAGQYLTVERLPHPFRFNSLILSGGPKSGKSLLASIIAQETLKRGFSVVVFEWSLLRDYLLDYKNKEQLEAIALDFENRDLVVVDGIQHIYDNMPAPLVFQLEKLAALRLRSGKPIVLTSDGHHESMNAGNNWASLLSSAYLVQLPCLDHNGNSR